ncbi:hypothetical protein [Roseomonas xinghualingensis]|uniref:hypothetical protein n=1 Tax=Roseomonas xinghualingensis TaxID=2986475 RepID=UPI0021F193BD|nr:hypothetical protein [Roseomonas sp. SXEYE001]MCV4209265.1 hypothetical protein [Roseomonas sp. SXEYE001]
MSQISELKLFEALATLSRASAEGGVPSMPDAETIPPAPEGAPVALHAMDEESRGVLGEAALAVAYGAFASQGGDSGPMHMLVGALGLMSLHAGEEPDPPAEIMGVLAEDERVECEIDRAGEAIDGEFGRDASAEALVGALEARIIGTAITLSGCTLPEQGGDQAAVRLGAARCLTRLAAALMTMNSVTGAGMRPGASAGSGMEAAPGP